MLLQSHDRLPYIKAALSGWTGVWKDETLGRHYKDSRQQDRTGGLYHVRQSVSGFVHCWAQGGTCRRTLRVVHGSGSNHKRNEVKHKWTVSNFRCLGKRTRSIQFQRRRRFQSRAGRACPRGTARRFNSSTSEGGGRWSKAGAIAGNGWSLAWRQLDAKYWGVPQCRKRIALVADFGGQRAAEILFERTGVSRHPDESIKAWEATPGSSQASPSGCDRTGERVVYDARGNGDGRTCPTITGDHENRITDYTAIAIERKTFNEQSFSHYKESDKCSTLKAKAGNIGNGSECLIAEKAIRWIIRRLTPVECERLQGFPSGWTDIGDWTDSKGKKHKYADSPRYKALGNSIALPQWFWLVQKMRPYLKEKPTLGSLFDGLGGFPLVWQRAYGEGTARWASEIEEFPMAVTKRRFGEE